MKNYSETEREKFIKELNTPFRVSKENIEFYQEYGYVKIKEVFTAETLLYYGNIITELVIKLNTLTKPFEERTTYEKVFLQIFNLWQEHPEAREFTFSKRLAQIATKLMGVQGVRLYHDQALYKEPSGGITPWHADQYYWPLNTIHTVTAWVPLQATPSDMGPLAFAQKSQSLAIGRDLEISDDSEVAITRELKAADLIINEEPFDLGEISFHSGWTFHRAGANTSDKPRKVMTVIYMDKNCRIAAPNNHNQKQDLDKWLPGLAIGEVAASKINPILFSY